ncbi:MAG: putative DNA binding domain-containing protein [Treponema sp.]|nr:putative DNA binding domain-containing protein [Treponema sp.]
MPQLTLKEKISLGESVSLEFKKCSNGIHSDVYETVCSFLNRFGGEILLGVEDDGTVIGIPQNAVNDLIRNFINCINNPVLFNPVCSATIEPVFIDGKIILKIFVPNASQVHNYKGKVYDRQNDSDIVITSTDRIAEMYIRKQNIFTERRVFPYLKIEHLREDVFEKARQLAYNRKSDHPWMRMNNLQLLKSVGLYAHDYEKGNDGLTLAAALLFGQDEVIQDICPTYWTDALCQKVDTVRYDDREIVQTNLIDSVEILMQFARKHTSDKFYLNENMQSISLRSNICREMIVNCLIHREFTSGRISKFVIQKDKIYVENPNKALSQGEITIENLEPFPKNPCISKVFREITYSEELGSGFRKLNEYVPLYSGKNVHPEFIDGDMFKIIVPFGDSVQAEKKNLDEKTNTGINFDCDENCDENCGENCGENISAEEKILEAIRENPKITQKQLATVSGLSLRGVEWNMAKLKNEGKIKRLGSDKKGTWEIVE